MKYKKISIIIASISIAAVGLVSIVWHQNNTSRATKRTIYPAENIKNENIDCISCALQRGDIKTIGGVIASTQHFQAQQDYAVPIPGFIIIASNRHVQSIDEFTADERKDFVEFLYQVRKSMREVLKIDTVYLMQEEDATHFHLWLFPRYDWMRQFGKKIKSVKPIMKWAQENLQTQENLQEVGRAAEKLRQSLGLTRIRPKDYVKNLSYPLHYPQNSIRARAE